MWSTSGSSRIPLNVVPCAILPSLFSLFHVIATVAIFQAHATASSQAENWHTPVRLEVLCSAPRQDLHCSAPGKVHAKGIALGFLSLSTQQNIRASLLGPEQALSCRCAHQHICDDTSKLLFRERSWKRFLHPSIPCEQAGSNQRRSNSKVRDPSFPFGLWRRSDPHYRSVFSPHFRQRIER